MNALEFGDGPVAITSVSFSPNGMMELTYVEQKDQSDYVSIIKTLLVDTRGARMTNLYNELVELLVDMVDAALVVARDPMPVFQSSKSKRERDEDDS